MGDTAGIEDDGWGSLCGRARYAARRTLRCRAMGDRGPHQDLIGVVRGVLELERDQPHVHLVIHRSPRELATIHCLGISALIRARQAFYVSAGPTVEVHRSPPRPPVADVR